MNDLLGSLPPNVSSYGGDIDSLYHLILWITAITFFLVQGTLLFFLWRYRASASKKAIYTHGNMRLEVLWTAVPTVIVIMLGFMSRSLWAHIKKEVPTPDVTVKVTGKQYNWEILYSGPDGKFGTPDDYQVDNDLKVPLNKVVQVILGSNDVIHSFFIPQARLKQDALPGREIRAWFKITKPGVYEIPCAELCGFGHSAKSTEWNSRLSSVKRSGSKCSRHSIMRALMARARAMWSGVSAGTESAVAAPSTSARVCIV